MEWEIKQVSDNFQVGTMNSSLEEFDPICSCEFYYQAEIMCAALKHYIYAKNYSSKGVDRCPGVTGKFLKRTVMMGLPV